ncbi:MAG: phosphate butyryltransferase, partial [Parasporobacterium sp.]|nr:phosphate butyryltransferase [Parasporobacterium sp.]
VDKKMPETLEAAELKAMNERGEITNCIVEGPISFDCATSPEAAELKGYNSPCAGDCDILLAPNIHAGNIMGKMLSVLNHSKLGGFVVGAKCPIILSSRGSSSEEKYLSLCLAAIAARNMK